MTVTVEQVAVRAGVSAATVARWKRDPDMVSACSRAAIEKAAEQLEDEAERPSFTEMLQNSKRMIKALQADVAIIKRLWLAERTAKEGEK